MHHTEGFHSVPFPTLSNSCIELRNTSSSVYQIWYYSVHSFEYTVCLYSRFKHQWCRNKTYIHFCLHVRIYVCRYHSCRGFVHCSLDDGYWKLSLNHLKYWTVADDQKPDWMSFWYGFLLFSQENWCTRGNEIALFFLDSCEIRL